MKTNTLMGMLFFAAVCTGCQTTNPNSEDGKHTYSIVSEAKTHRGESRRAEIKKITASSEEKTVHVGVLESGDNVAANYPPALKEDLKGLKGIWYKLPANTNRVSAVILNFTDDQCTVSRPSVGGGSESGWPLRLGQVNGKRILLKAYQNVNDIDPTQIMAEYQLARDTLTLTDREGMSKYDALEGEYFRGPVQGKGEQVRVDSTGLRLKELDGVWLKVQKRNDSEERPMVLLIRGDRMTIREIGGGVNFGHGSFKTKEKNGKQVCVTVPFFRSDKETVIFEYTIHGDVLTISGAPTPIGMTSYKYEVAGEWVPAKRPDTKDVEKGNPKD